MAKALQYAIQALRHRIRPRWTTAREIPRSVVVFRFKSGELLSLNKSQQCRAGNTSLTTEVTEWK